MNLIEIIKQNKDKFPESITEETIKQIVDTVKTLGYAVLVNSNEKPEFIPKSRLDEVTVTKNDYKAQIADLNKQLGNLKTQLRDNEDLKRQIETLQNDIKKSGEKAKSALAKAQAKVFAAKANAKDPDDVLKFVDFSKVVVNDDETVTGLEEQINSLIENKAYLFEEKKAKNTGGSNPAGGSNTPMDQNPWKHDTFNLTKQGQIMKADPAKAQILMKEAGVI